MAPIAFSSPPTSTDHLSEAPLSKEPISRDTKANGVANNEAEESSLQAICHGTILPGIPSFPSFSAHRLWALNHMTAVFRHWSRHSYTEGLSGHISIRDPEYPHLFWMNPLAVHFGLLRASDMLLLSDKPADDGRIFAGGNVTERRWGARTRCANKAGWAIHSAVHRRRSDVGAVCHAHTKAGKAWSCMGGRGLEMLNQDVCDFYGEALAVYDQYGGVVVGEALGEGEQIARALGPRGKAAILVNHGLLSVGTTVDEAGFLFGLLERSCAIQLEVEKAYGVGKGERRIINDREAEFNFRVASQPVSTGLKFDLGDYCVIGLGDDSLMRAFQEPLFYEFQPEYDYEVAMSHDQFQDLEEKDLRIKISE
ncbi:hypothetical protein MMC25_002032 [Agyrium rufum]|nr:hypothetical protein [Agyrium rufum]